MRMNLEPRELSWIAEAPQTYVFEASLQSPRPAVFAAIAADPSTWTWFPGLSKASYPSAPPHGVGSTREVTMAGTYYRETMLAWDEPTRWAYRVDESSAPIAHSLVEDWVLEEDHGSTVVRWTFAIDPRAAFLVGKPSAGVLMGNLFRRAMKNLDRHLQSSADGDRLATSSDGVDVGA